MRLFFLLFISVTLLAGCAVPASRWRSDAYSRYNSALAAGSQKFAPEETENIRQTLTLAERYFTKQQQADADRLYQLSYQKSQLLYRNLVLGKIRQEALLVVQNDVMNRHEETSAEADHVRNSKNESGTTNTSTSATPDAERWNNPAESKTPPVPSNKAAHSPLSSLAPAKRISRGSNVAKRSDHGRTTIYLTFDDGPSRFTLPIAAYLNSQGIAATFFALGNNVRGHEKVVRDTVALGHRVGNHTLSHDLRKLNGSLHQGVNEIEKTAAMIEKLGGDGKMVRIPYGASSKILTSTVALEGGQIFDWDIDSLDSSKRGSKDHAFIEQTVIRQLHKSERHHVIMLFHDGVGHEATLVAIRKLIPSLKLEGYRFGLLSRNDHVAQSRTERNPTP